MKKMVIALVVVVLLISAVPMFASAGSPNKPGPVSDFSSENILVKFKPGTSLSEAAEIHRQLGGQAKETIPGIDVQVVKVPRGQEKEKAKAYSSNPGVAYAEPDFVAQALGSPDDPYFGRQWGLTKIGAPQAWDVTTGSTSINIAILDTGVDLDHPDLVDKIVSNINFTSSPTADDVYGHGTHVAGIAAAATDNGIGVAGVGCGSTIMNVKVLNDKGSGTYAGIISGIMWAVDNGAEVINLSLGGSSYSSAMEDAINYAWSKGVVVAGAAGNYGSTTPFYPAAHPNCMAVAATDSWDDVASFSNYGTWVDVAAPGVAIYATLKDGGYGYKGGTSMASPHVAGLAGLVFTTVSDTNGNGRLNDEVRGRIEATCDDIGATGIGHGRINAARAVGDGAPVPPGAITGEVTDAEDGSAISGAEITDGIRTVLTDGAGSYTIDNVPPGTYEVTASKTAYESASSTAVVVSGGNTLADFSLSEITASGSITGSVTDAASGSAVMGATVTDGTRTTTTDAAGRYAITDVPPGTYQVTASKSGYQSSSLTVTVVSEGNAIADFSLTEVSVTGSITGLVTDAETGSPVVGATVTDGTRTTTTDALGKYTIANVPSGTYQVTASKEGYQSSSMTVNVLSGSAVVANFSLYQLVLTGTITGTVTDAANRSPIAGATVTDGTRTTTTDALGKYTIANVPSWRMYRVTASKEGYGSSSLWVIVFPGRTTLANLSLTKVGLPGSITGSVTDAEDGSPIAGATVTDGTRTATTDALGKYTIADVPSGTYQVTASKEGYESSSMTVNVLPGSSAVANFSLTGAILPGSVTGSVTDATNGSPIAGATVTDGTRTTTTDAMGKYTFTNVPPGTYQLTASRSGYERSVLTVTVVTGGTAVIDFSLNPEPVTVNTMWVNRVRFTRFGDSLFIEVSVVTASGRLVGADVDLTLVCSTGGLWSFSGTTNSAGFVNFYLPRAPAGSYVATVTSLTCTGFIWDASKGITAAIYA